MADDDALEAVERWFRSRGIDVHLIAQRELWGRPVALTGSDG